MAITSHAAALFEPSALIRGLLRGRPKPLLGEFGTSPLPAGRLAPPFRFQRPLLPIYNLLSMSAGVERGAEAAVSARSATGGTVGNRSFSRTPHAGESSSDTAADQPDADPDDLHRLVLEHSDAIYRLALSVVRDPALAEDVSQEALVKAWLALPSFRGESSIRSWLLRITHNTAISTLRRRRAVVLDPHDLPERQTRIDRSVESRVQSHVVMDEFVEALDTLDELSRSIVVLRELEGLSYEEISDVLGVPMPTVKTRLLRARRRLSNVLRDWA